MRRKKGGKEERRERFLPEQLLLNYLLFLTGPLIP
jgi:hypothetical protein